MNTTQTSGRLQELLDRLRAGDDSARHGLIDHSVQRFRELASRMMPKSSDLRVLNDSGDVLQRAMVRLFRVLENINPPSVRDFYGLATRQIRWVLLDLAKEMRSAKQVTYVGQLPQEVIPVDQNDGPGGLMGWSEFHEKIDSLPQDEREVLDLLFYQDLTQEEAAKVLDMSLRTIRRRWQQARLRLHAALHGEWPK